MIFLKQYGERRTGTNFLRALLQANFSDLTVLMHVLGDKHSLPAPFQNLLREVRHLPDPAFQFVHRATQYSPARTTQLENVEQLEYLREVAERLYEAVQNGRLHYLICIKSPYAWAASIGRWYGYERAAVRTRYTSSQWKQMFASEVERYNTHYAAWWQLKIDNPHKTIVVDYESLCLRPLDTLNKIAKQMNLPLPTSPVLTLPYKAQAMNWDQQPSDTSGRLFNSSYYEHQHYLADVPPPLKKCLEKQLDQDLMNYYGYSLLGVTQLARE